MAEIERIPVSTHEDVRLWRDEQAGLTAIIAVHSTALGPAVGGTRWQPYAGRDEALRDVLRLSSAMTMKAAGARLPFGGGKAVVIGDPSAKTDAQLRSYAQFVSEFRGKFITTTDVGTTTAEVDRLSELTPHMCGMSPAKGGSGDTSALTATTVLQGMHATLEALDGNPEFAGRRASVVGVGKVGGKAAVRLAEAGAEVLVADVREDAAAALAAEIGATALPVEDAMRAECDVLSPNALGGVLNGETIPRLRCRTICGAANNQLERDPEDAALIAERGILYAPDFIVNSGGLISVAIEIEGWTPQQSQQHAEGVFDTTRKVFHFAAEHGLTPATAAEAIVRRALGGTTGMAAAVG